MEAPQGVELTGTNGGKAITQHAMLFLALPVLRPSACSPGREHPFGPRNEFASIVRFPNRHMPPSPRRGGDRLKICGKLRPCTAMVLHLRGCGRVARRRLHCWIGSRSSPCGGSRGPFRISGGFRFPVSFPFPRGPWFPFSFVFSSGPGCARRAWSVSVAAVNDVMRFTRYACAGSRESRYDGKRQKPDN